ncbi:MAG: tRNA (cytidine/uridine-2-O-)-methyltransferase TrmJ [Betaproteobacteria bacterium]|jgi:tRNA/rRNA methyltransferase|nr:tRNA (cytidine/uridine-2-O-)-methyltransferase TrmJ [Betaproteobacteria bacterium]
MPRTDPLKNIRIVLCETSHPGNIGAAARAMKTMGLTKLHLVQPQRFPDPEANWRAARATDVLDKAKVHETLDAALHGVGLSVACSARTREIAVPQSGVREVAARAIAVARSQSVALVFGNETFGLTTEQVNKCGVLATIPANPRYPSLNLAAAVQVFAYELRTAAQENDAPTLEPRLAPHEDVERFYAHLETLMTEVGFLNPEHPKKLMPRLRRLFARARLEPEEINILRGIIKALSRSNR